MLMCVNPFRMSRAAVRHQSRILGVFVTDIHDRLPAGQFFIRRIKIPARNRIFIYINGSVENRFEGLDLLSTTHAGWDSSHVPDFGIYPVKHTGSYIGTVRKK